MTVLKKSCQLFIVLLSVFFISACNSPGLEPLKSNATILAFGDSLTAGVGTDKSSSYPAVLKNLTGLKVINAGISGETTNEGLARFPDVLADSQADLLILIEGGNDILRNHKAAETKSNLASMIKIAQAQSLPVVLIGVPEKKLFSSSAPLYQELADEYGLVYHHDLISKLIRSPELKSDPIHFNQAGYQKMAEAIYQLLQESGAL